MTLWGSPHYTDTCQRLDLGLLLDVVSNATGDEHMSRRSKNIEVLQRITRHGDQVRPQPRPQHAAVRKAQACGGLTSRTDQRLHRSHAQLVEQLDLEGQAQIGAARAPPSVPVASGNPRSRSSRPTRMRFARSRVDSGVARSTWLCANAAAIVGTIHGR